MWRRMAAWATRVWRARATYTATGPPRVESVDSVAFRAGITIDEREAEEMQRMLDHINAAAARRRAS